MDATDSGPASVDGALVVGMHRSGTSAVTRSLSLLGLSVCRPFDMIPAQTGNERGHWESRSLTLLNDELLDQLDGSWWCPPRAAEVASWAEAMPDATAARLRAAHHEAHPAARPWVWKDPRVCVTLPIWRAALAGRYVAVLVIRDPLEIARSLEVRNRMARPLALALWERYLASAVRHLEGAPVWVCRYADLLGDSDGWCRAAGAALTSSGLDIEPDAAALERVGAFLSADLRHHESRADEPRSGLTERQHQLWQWLDSSVGHHPRFSAASLGPSGFDDASDELDVARRAFLERRASHRDPG